jgi:hypothetical protein
MTLGHVGAVGSGQAVQSSFPEEGRETSPAPFRVHQLQDPGFDGIEVDVRLFAYKTKEGRVE